MRAATIVLITCVVVVAAVGLLYLGMRTPAPKPVEVRPPAPEAPPSEPAVAPPIATEPRAEAPEPAVAPPPPEPVAPAVPGRMVVRVLDNLTGNPVTDFEIQWSARAGVPSMRQQAPDGVAVLPTDLQTPAEIEVRAKDYEPGRAVIEQSPALVPEGETVDGPTIRLERIVAPQGRVIDGETGKPVEGAVVRPAYGTVSPQLLLMPPIQDDPTCTTGADGVFGLKPFNTSLARYLVVWKEGYAARFVFLGEIEPRKKLEVSLTHGGGIRARLLRDGAPVEGLVPLPKLHIDQERLTYSPYAAEYGGTCRLMFATPGDYVMEVFDSVEEQDWGRIAITVTEGQTTEQDYDTATFGGFFGSMSTRDRGADVTIEMSAEGQASTLLYRVIPGEDGTFRLGYVSPGSYEVRVISNAEPSKVKRYTRTIGSGQWLNITVDAP